MPAESVNCCVTSPPYWNLRDYNVEGQIGLESSPETYTLRLVEVFEEVRRVLRDDGTVWLNLGDSYVSKPPGCARPDHTGSTFGETRGQQNWTAGSNMLPRTRDFGNLKNKDLIGMPWRVAFALQAAGWYLRSEIIWHKKNPLPESVRDRPTKSHEQIFLLSKSPRYYYDADAIAEPALNAGRTNKASGVEAKNARAGYGSDTKRGFTTHDVTTGKTRKCRDVWTISVRGYPGAHFATYPPDLIRPCIRAGCPPNGVVLDPFSGAGTTGLVALQEGRQYIGIELNSEYVQMSLDRLAPLVEAPALSNWVDKAPV